MYECGTFARKLGAFYALVLPNVCRFSNICDLVVLDTLLLILLTPIRCLSSYWQNQLLFLCVKE